jgi:hypothetical protein
MISPIAIADLEIVGYANRLTSKMWPTVVPPVFRLQAEHNRVFLPPFVMRDAFVYTPTETTALELSGMNEKREVTLFETPLAAQPNFELWIDEQGQPQYEAIPTAAARLRGIAESNIELAYDALRNGQDVEAENRCRVALCADDRLIEPLAITAAIARKRNDPAGERTMARLALGRATPMGFKLMVDGFAAVHQTPPAAEANDLLNCRIMYGIAAYKAAA